MSFSLISVSEHFLNLFSTGGKIYAIFKRLIWDLGDSQTCRSFAFTGQQRLQATFIGRSLAFRHRTVMSRRLPSCRRCSWATTTFHSETNMHRVAAI